MITPITAEIIREYFESVAEEIIKTMVRASVSPIFNEAHDCSAGVFSYDGKQVGLVSRGDAVPVHIYACLTSVEACIRFFRGDLNDGDVILACDPFFGGTHIGDYTIILPVFCNNKPVFFASVRAHMLDVGGPVPGGLNAEAEEVWQEGFRFPPVKVFEKGERRRDVWDLLKANNRLPDIAIADINAMIGACKIGEERIRAVVDKYGLTTVQEGVRYTFDYSEKKFRNAIAQWPTGTYTGRSLLDQDFRGNENINVDVCIEVKEEEVVVDFSGSHAQSPGVINSVVGNTISYVYGCFSAVCPEVPINSGFFRPIRIVLPEGSVVNPDPPAAAGYATICIGCTIGEAVMQALGKIVPERVGTTSIDLSMLWTHGEDPRTKNFFISYDYHASPVSSGGTYGVDGWGGWSALFCALQLASVEMTEIQYPFLYLEGEYSTDFRRRCADIEIQLLSVEQVMLRALAAYSADRELGALTSMIKIRRSEVQQAISELGVEAAGYYALPMDVNALRHGWNEEPVGDEAFNGLLPGYLFLRAASIYSGSNEIQRNIVAKHQLGL